MCIFTGTIHPVVSVTKIFITMVSTAHQLTVYENNIRSPDTLGMNKNKDGVAMILPVPGNGEITMVDFSGYSSFFSDLEKDLPIGDGNIFKKTYCLSSPSADAPKFLEIQRVGAYGISIAKNLNDLKNLDWSHFNLNPEVTQLLHSTYSKNFGFIVAKIILEKEMTPHPIAYIHEIPEHNRGNLSSSLFVPTMHEGHSNGIIQHKAFWDHSIFLMGDYFENENYWNVSVSVSAVFVRNVNFRKLNNIMKGISSNNYCLIRPSATALKRKVIKGVYENCDLYFKTMTPLPSYFDPQIYDSSFPLIDQINDIQDFANSTLLNDTCCKKINIKLCLLFLFAFLLIFTFFYMRSNRINNNNTY